MAASSPAGALWYTAVTDEIPASLLPGVPTLVFEEHSPSSSSTFRIFIGDLASAQDAAALRTLGVTAAIAVAARLA